MSDRDRELDEILKSLQNLQPRPEQMARWRSLAPLRRRTGVAARFVELAVAASIGFATGAWYFKQVQNNQPQHLAASFDSSFDTKFDPDATVERVYVKGD